MKTNTPGVSKDCIVVANSAAQSGIFASTGDPINAGIRAYFDMINSRGGIDGRKLKFIHTDDRYDPKTAESILSSYLNENKIFAYVGHFGGSIVMQTLDLIKKSGMPVVYFGTGVGALYNEHAMDFMSGANCYPIQPVYITEGRAMASIAIHDFNAKKIGILYTDTTIGHDLLSGINRTLKEHQTDSFSEIIPAAEMLEQSAFLKSIRDTVLSMKDYDPDFIIIAAGQESFPDIAAALAETDTCKTVLTSYVNTVVTIAMRLIPVIKNKFDIYSFGWLDYTSQRHMAALNEASDWLGDYAMNGYAHCGWIGAHFLCEGLKRVSGKEITWKSFREAMESSPIENPFGGFIDYADGKRLGTEELSLHKIDYENPFGWSEIFPLRNVVMFRDRRCQ